MDLEKLHNCSHDVAYYGLASIFLISGLTKVFSLNVWIGYTPDWFVSNIPLTSSQFMMGVGVFELFVALMLFVRWKPYIISMILTVWLLALTVVMVSIEIWSAAIRDLGLTLLAYYVASDQYRQKNG